MFIPPRLPLRSCVQSLFNLTPPVVGPQPLSVNLKNSGSSFIGKHVSKQYPVDSPVPREVGLTTIPILLRHIHLFFDHLLCTRHSSGSDQSKGPPQGTYILVEKERH